MGGDETGLSASQVAAELATEFVLTHRAVGATDACGKMITVAPGITSTFQAKGRRRKLEFRGSFIDIFPFIRKAEMQVQDQRLLLTLRHLHSVLQELRTESAPWEDATSSRGTSPIRARAGSESRGRPPISSQGLAQLLQGTDSRRSSLP
ncbi:uncharacterized protein C20orf202 homolog [Zalophus californianus]|uniref:Uncharacterized protein C20orf202 homolog n=1 Tax=Zalophus californianus TaxID=9704 RepID=A0A6J2FF22_ZALCA|nr:uncharacterized protein C20orf202 homolog [Zalophus californianus]